MSMPTTLLKLLILFSFCSVLLTYSRADASNYDIAPAQSEEITTENPAWFVYSVQAGETIESKVRVRNFGDEEILLTIDSSDFEMTREGSFGLKNGQNNALGSWIDIREDSYSVSSRGLVEIPFRLTIPQDTKEGEYAGGITAELVQPSQSSIDVKLRQGVRVYVRVGSPSSVQGGVEKFELVDITNTQKIQSLPNNQLLGKNRIALMYKPTYTGNVFGVLYGTVELTLPSGKRLSKPISNEFYPSTQSPEMYVYFDIPYEAGTIVSELRYAIKPLNGTEQEQSGIKTTQLQLSQQELDRASNAESSLFNKPLTPTLAPRLFSFERIRLVIIALLLAIILLIGIVYILRMKISKSPKNP